MYFLNKGTYHRIEFGLIVNILIDCDAMFNTNIVVSKFRESNTVKIK